MDNIIPLLSVVIPTRNRQSYIQFSIQSILKISSSKLQLVIMDNSDDSTLNAWIRNNIVDSRLIYSYIGKRMSMTENYNLAMKMVAGEYVSLIGDDDSVQPEIIDATIWAKSQNLDAIVPKSLVNYVWPDLQMHYRAQKPGEIRIYPFSGNISFPDCEIEMRKCAIDAGQNFHKLPKVYYGIVKMDCMNRVNKSTGTYFPGVSPDMSAAIAVANYTKRICYLDYPLFIPGSSAKSNAGASGTNKHIGLLRNQSHLHPACEENWSKIVPKFYSVQTIWAEAAVNALRATGRIDILQDFNVPLLYAECVMWHPMYASITIRNISRALREINHSVIWGTIKIIFRYLHLWFLRANTLGKRLLKINIGNIDYYSVHGINNIDEAVQVFLLYLKTTGKKFP